MKINRNTLVYIGFMLILFKYTMSYSAFQLSASLNTILMLSGVICFLQKILVTKYSKKSFIIMCFGIIYGLYTMVHISDDLFLISVFFIAALKDVELDKIIKLYCIITLLCFISIIVGSLVSNSNVTLSAAYRAEGEYVSRYTLGFLHPNSLQGMYLRFIAALILTSYLEKYRTMKYIILMLLNYILFSLSDSRAGFLVTIIILVISYFEKKCINFLQKKIFYYLILFLQIIIVGFTIFATYNVYNYSILFYINNLITGRFLHANRFVESYPVTLMGQNITEMSKYYTLDCGIISTLLNYGIVGISFIVFIYSFGLYGLWKEKRFNGMISVTALVIYSVVESIYINPFINIGFLVCIFYIMNIREKDKVDSY